MQEAPKPGSRAAKAAAMTHEERVAVIAGQIEKRLRGHDKVQVSNLFPSLNQLAEYRVDKQDALLNRVLAAEGVQDATLVAYQPE